MDTLPEQSVKNGELINNSQFLNWRRFSLHGQYKCPVESAEQCYYNDLGTLQYNVYTDMFALICS